MAEEDSSIRATTDRRVRLTKLLADLDVLFAISFMNREAGDRVWSLTFELEDGQGATLQLVFYEDVLSVVNAVELDAPLSEQVMRELLALNAMGPIGAIAAREKVILASASIPESHLDAAFLRLSMGSVLQLVSKVRNILTSANVTFNERAR